VKCSGAPIADTAFMGLTSCRWITIARTLARRQRVAQPASWSQPSKCRRGGGLQPRADECRTFYGWPAAVTIECGAHRYPPNPPLGTLRVGLRGPVRRGGCDVAEGAVANSIEDPGGQASSEGGSSSTPSQRCGLLSTWPTMPGTCRAREREPHRIRPACWALGSSSYILSASIRTTGAPVPSRPFRA
jgi:hypothetical protein